MNILNYLCVFLQRKHNKRIDKYVCQKVFLMIFIFLEVIEEKQKVLSLMVLIFLEVMRVKLEGNSVDYIVLIAK